MKGNKAFVCFLLFVLFNACLAAEVQVKEKSKAEFPGMMGKMFGMFGGKSAREGIVSTETVVGNRKLEVTGESGELIDLDEEKVYELDLKKKSYRVTSFDEYRRKSEEAAARLAEASEAQQSRDEAPEEGDAPEKEFEVDFQARATGQQREINGFSTREAQIIVTVREKGKTLEQGGGMVLTSSLWMTEKMAELDEIADFRRRYAEKLYGSSLDLSGFPQMAGAMAMYPGLKDALTRMDSEQVNMEGTPVLTEMVVESVQSEQQMAENRREQEEESSPSSMGGLLGGFAKKLGKKKSEPEAAAPNRKQVMKTTSELLSVSTAVETGAVQIPPGFKEKK